MEIKPDTNYIKDLLKNGYDIARKNPDSARILFQKEVEVSNRINFTRGVVSGYEKLGFSYIVTGNYEEGRKCFLQGLAVSNDRKYEKYVGTLYNSVASTYSSQDNYEEAVPYYFKGIQFSEQHIKDKEWTDTIDNIHFQNLMNCYNNLADIFSRMQQNDKAFAYLEKGEQLARQKRRYEMLTAILKNKSEQLLEWGKIQPAEQCAMEALAICEQHNIDITLQYIYCVLGDISEAKKNYPEAIRYYNKAIASSTMIDNKIASNIGLGKLYVHEHQYALAEQTLLKAEALTKEHKSLKQLQNVYYLLQELYEGQKKYQQAFNALSESTKIGDSFAVSERRNEVNLLETKYRTAQKDKSIAENKLLIGQQEAKINQKNLFISGIAAIAILVVLFFVFLYTYRQRLQAEKIKALKDEEKIKMLLSVVKGEEKERNRLAGELHDGIGGLLSTVKMFFSNLQKKETTIANYPDFHDAMKLLDETITEVRKTAHNLMPELLFNYGLSEATRLFCDTFQKANNIKIDFQYYGFIGRLNRSFELFIYRILQELLQNISKHANATVALVQMSLHDNMLSITIEDNGIGIKESQPGMEGMGLQIIRSRVNDLEGQFIINSGEKGTSIYIEIDIKNQDKFAV